jgi:hypothetical protein
VRKIPTLFQRDENDRRYVTDVVTPGCEWVLAGEGTATRKYDGTCVMLDPAGRWHARREVKPNGTPPPLFQAVETDPVTGKTVGWEPIAHSSFAKYHAQALDAPRLASEPLVPGTYELVGPKVNGNPEGVCWHMLIRHADAALVRPFNLTFEGLRDTVRVLHAQAGVEGIVWHHPDGRMAKLKARDFPKEANS